MRRWIAYSAGAVVVSLLLSAAYVAKISNPESHFQKRQLPVLVMPAGANAYIRSESFPVLSWIRKTGAAPASAISSAASPTAPATDRIAQPAQAVQKKQDNFNMLIVGTDARENELSRADVIMVVHVIPSEKRVNVLSIPRDTMVYIQGTGYTKVNHAHILGEMKGGNREGTETLLQTVSNFLQVPINYYVKTNFQGFKDLIDAIGGVDVPIENPIFLRSIGENLPAGLQHFNGDLALGLVRERWAFPEGDFGRQKEQNKILKGIAKKVLAPEHVVELASTLAKVKKDLIDTNLTDSDMLSLARLFTGLTDEGFTYLQVQGESVVQEDPLVHAPLYYWKPDAEQVKGLMKTYFDQ
ncbi:LCP family protein [Paenibacillus ferrarius]|uniref:LCP family protein n=1 Tax=Paenibacillus ferrarius TaxID=1469647 RepID=UPI003D2C8B04